MKSLVKLSEKFKREFFFFALVLAAALGVMVGSGIAYKVGAVSPPRYAQLETLAKIIHIVENNYVREVDEKDLIQGAIDGMLGTLDPHTTFLPPTTYGEMRIETRGKFTGVGIEITQREDSGITVVAPIEDTPAFKEGIKTGDLIVSIDGDSTREMTLADAVKKLRGERGTTVKLGIMRKGFEKPKDFVLMRDTIQIKSVKYRLLEPGFGYVRITSFQDHTAYDLNKAIDNLESETGKLKGLVLDLRNNPGGLLDQAIKVTDTFLADGKIVITKGRNKKQIKVEEAHERGTRENFPMIVLVNGGSASASEIVAGALQDNGRAVVLGTQTFGKGTVQTIIEFDDNSALKLTIARYYTPNERDIQEKGILPDIIIDNEEGGVEGKSLSKMRLLREADLKGHLPNSDGAVEKTKSKEKSEEETPKIAFKPEGFGGDKDIQLKAAIDFLKTWQVFKNHNFNAGAKVAGSAGKMN